MCYHGGTNKWVDAKVVFTKLHTTGISWEGGTSKKSLMLEVNAYTEPVFLNVYGAQESIPSNEFRQPI